METPAVHEDADPRVAHLTPARKPNREDPDVVVISQREARDIEPYIFGGEHDA